MQHRRRTVGEVHASAERRRLVLLDRRRLEAQLHVHLVDEHAAAVPTRQVIAVIGGAGPQLDQRRCECRRLGVEGIVAAVAAQYGIDDGRVSRIEALVVLVVAAAPLRQVREVQTAAVRRRIGAHCAPLDCHGAALDADSAATRDGDVVLDNGIDQAERAAREQRTAAARLSRVAAEEANRVAEQRARLERELGVELDYRTAAAELASVVVDERRVDDRRDGAGALHDEAAA